MSRCVAPQSLLHANRYPIKSIPKLITRGGETKRFSVIKRSKSKPLKIGGNGSLTWTGRELGPTTRSSCVIARATDPSAVSDSNQVVYSKTFPLEWTKTAKGKICTKLDPGEEEGHWQLTVSCNLPGKWILRWGVQFVGDDGSEWDQPPRRMRPPGSVVVKDYGVDTPMNETLTDEGDRLHEVKIDIKTSNPIASISFVLKDEETGTWFKKIGGDFKVPLVDHLQEEDASSSERSGESHESPPKSLEAIHEEQDVQKNVPIENKVHVSVKKCGEMATNVVRIEADILEDVVVHWGVCKDDQKKWMVPASPHPPDTQVFKNKALRTRLQRNEDGSGRVGNFTLEKDFAGFLFLLRLSDGSWLQYKGKDFFIPLQIPYRTGDEDEDGEDDDKGVSCIPIVKRDENEEYGGESSEKSNSSGVSKTCQGEKKQQSSGGIYTNGLIKNIRELVSDISSEKKWIRKSKNQQQSLLTEIEKLASQAYSIFRTNIPSFSKQKSKDAKAKQPSVQLHSGTGTGYEIVCQGFNWESHKSGKWYMELHEKADYLSSLGFTIIWLPPPTESISPEGYMPKDLYNLNSRYGSVDELKAVISKFHEVNIKVLGDVVLNHRCAEYQNQNGIWNIFGGRLNWDDRAVVGDDPHFQGRGNKSSGDNFHAAPNIDHSQDFVRRDIAEWMRWLKNEVGYDGWRLDFVRGFWGGYVKDYLDATEPYFSVGEYWDSLSYTYSEMDYDQNAHRQRIIDWINATGGFSGAFDVTTKGILHSAVEDRQYWRLKDPEGKPPGVVGWWPSRAVTFIENHDTGSTQGHWRFPNGKEMQGYAYILTHPGTPSIFYDHFYSDLHAEICTLIAVRRRNKLSCRSDVKIVKAKDNLYAAIIDEKVVMKIGPEPYQPPSDRKWSLAIEGNLYQVWEIL